MISTGADKVNACLTMSSRSRPPLSSTNAFRSLLSLVVMNTMSGSDAGRQVWWSDLVMSLNTLNYSDT